MDETTSGSATKDGKIARIDEQLISRINEVKEKRNSSNDILSFREAYFANLSIDIFENE